MFVLTHVKNEKVHELTLSGFPMTSTVNFIVETEFLATDGYNPGDTFKVNNTAFTAIMNPDIYGAFSANEVVHCVLDFKTRKIVVVNIHKAKFDALYVYNAGEPDVTESTPQGSAMESNKTSYVTPLFFGFGDNNTSVMHSALVGYSFSIKDIWPNDNAADAYTDTDFYRFEVTVSIDLGGANGFPTKTVKHTITRRCEIVSNEFTLDNIPSGDTTVTLSLTVRTDCPVQGVLKNTFTFFIQCSDMSTKKDIPIIYFPVPGKDDEAYMLGWSDVDAVNITMPAVIPRTEYKCIGMISPRMLTEDSSGYYVNDAKDLLTPDEITLLNSYNSALTYRIFKDSTSTPFSKLNSVNFGSECRFMMLERYALYKVRQYDETYNGLMVPYFNFNACRNINYIDSVSTDSYTYASPVIPGSYPLTEDNCVDIDIHPDPNLMLWFDTHSYSYSYGFGTFIHDDKWKMGQICNAISTYNRYGSTCGDQDVFRLMDIKIGECVATNWGSYTFYYRAPKNINCAAKYIFAGSDSTYDYEGYGYDARLMYYNKYGILSSTYPPEDMVIGVNKPYRNSTSLYSSNYNYSRINAPFWSSGNQIYYSLPSRSMDPSNLTSYSSYMIQNRREEDRIPMKIKIETLLIYHYLYMYMSESYQRLPFVNMDIDAKGILAYHDLNHPKAYAIKHLEKWFDRTTQVDVTSTSSYSTIAAMSYFGYPMTYNSVYTSNWHGYADSTTTSTSSYNTTYLYSGYESYWLPSYANVKMHAKFKYIYAPFMKYAHHGSSSVYLFSCIAPKVAIDGEDYFVEVEGDFICGGIYSYATFSSYGTIIAGTEATHWKPYMAMYQYTNPDSSSTSQVRIGSDCDTVKVGGMLSIYTDYSSYTSRNINYMGPTFEVFYGTQSSAYYRPRYEAHKLGSIPAGRMASLNYTQWIGNNYSEIIHGNLKYDEIADGAIFGTCAFNGTFWDPTNSTLDLSNVGALGYMPFAFSVGIDNIEYPDDDKPIESMAENWFEGLVGSSYRAAIAAELAKPEDEQNFRPYNMGPSGGFSALTSYNPPLYTFSTTYNAFWNASDTSNYIDARTIIKHIHFDESKPFRYTCRVISGLYVPWMEFVPVSDYENRNDFNKLGRYIWGNKTHTSKTGEEYPVYQFKNSDVTNPGGMCEGLPDYELADHTISYYRAMRDSDIPDGGLPLFGIASKVANKVPDLRYQYFINGTDSVATGSNSTGTPLADGILGNFYNGGTTSTGTSNYTAPLGHWISYLVVCEQIQRVKEGKLTAAQVQFPKVEICDTVECIDAFFLANFPVYFDPEHPEDFEWRIIDLPNIRRLGDYPFAFIYFIDKTSADTGKKFMSGTSSKGLTFTQAGKDLFEGNHPIKKIKFGKYLERLPKGLEGIDFEIDPENPNFAFKDGYIYNSDYTIMITGNKDLILATTDADDPITIPNTLEACCCWDSLVKHDRRIREFVVHGSKFDIVDNQGDLRSGTTINAAYTKFEFPPNLTRLEVTGNTNIPFDTVRYPDRELYIKLWGTGENDLDTNDAHRFYTRTGCTCGEIFTMQNKYSPYIQMTYNEYMATTETGAGYNFNKAKNYSWHHYYPNATSKYCIRHVVQPNKNDFASSPATASFESIVYTNRVNDDPLIDNIVISCTSNVKYITSPNHIDQINLVNSPSTRSNGTPLFVTSDVDTFTTAASMYFKTDNPDAENHYILYGKTSTSATTDATTLVRVPSGYLNDVSVPASVQIRPGAFYGCNIENVVLEHKAKKWFPDAYTSTSSSYPAEDLTVGYWASGNVDIPEYLEPYQSTTYTSLSSIGAFKPGNQYWMFAGATIENLTVNIGVCDGAVIIDALLGYQASTSSYTYRGVVWFENYNLWLDRAVYNTSTGTSHHFTYDRQYALDARSHIANLFIDNVINGSARTITRLYYPLFIFHNHPSDEPTHIHFPDGTNITQLCDNALQYYYLDDTYGNPIRNCKIFGKEATKGTKNLPVWDMTSYDGYNVKAGNDVAIMVNGGEVTIENSTFEELLFGEGCVGNDVHISNCDITEFPSAREQGTIYMDKLYPFVSYKTEEDFDKFVIVGGFGSTIPADTFSSDDWYVSKYQSNSALPGGYGLTPTLVDAYMRAFHFSTAERMIDLLESAGTIESGNYFCINLSSTTSPVLTISGAPNWSNPFIYGIDYSIIESIDNHGQIKLAGYDTDTPAIGYHGTVLEAFPDFTDYQKIAFLLSNSYISESRGTVTDLMTTRVTYNQYPDDNIEFNATATIQEGYIYDKSDVVFQFLRRMYGKGLEIVVDCPDRSISSAPYYASKVCTKITYNTYFTGNQTPRFRYGTDYVYNSPVAYVNVWSDNLKGTTVYRTYNSTYMMSNYTRKLIDENPDWTMSDLIDTIIDPRVTPLKEYGWVKSLTFGPDVTDIEIMTMSAIGMKELSLGEDGRRVYFINGGYSTGGINRNTPIGYLRDVTVKNIELVRPDRWINNEHFAGGNFYQSSVRNVTIGLSDASVAWLTPTVWNAIRTTASSAVPITNTTLGYNNDYPPFYHAFHGAAELQTLDLTNIEYIFPYMFGQMYAGTYNANDLTLHQGVPLRTIKSDQPIKEIGRCGFWYAFVVDPEHRNLSTLLEKGTGSVTWVGANAFQDSNLYMTDFTSVEYIGSNSFVRCRFPADENGDVTITLPSATSIQSSAFSESNLTKVYVKRGCTYGSNAFPASCLVIEID